MRTLIAAAVAVVPLVLQPDPSRVLAGMRQALGGDAAIAAVQGFSVDGSELTKLDGRTSEVGVEWVAALPDSAVRVRRVFTPVGNIVETDGFRGDALIYRRFADMPLPFDPVQGQTPAERAASEAAGVRHWKQEFLRFAVGLIGPPAAVPVDVSYAGQHFVAGRACDLVTLKSTDGYTATLAVDAATHLPVSVSWMAKPPFTLTTTSTVVVRSGPGAGPVPTAPPASVAPPSLPTGDPTAGMSPVEYQILFDDFKVVDGLNWPHRFTETVAGQVHQTTRVKKYKLNPKVDAKLFDPSRR